MAPGDGGRLAAPTSAAKVASSIRRRISQIKQHFPQLVCVSIRGSVQTRLDKLGSEVDAVILAAAGVKRLGLADRMDGIIPMTQMLPAVAQGTLGIQSCDDRSALNALVSRLNHADTVVRTRAERAFLARLEGGCQVPIAAFAELDGEQLQLRGLVGEEDGSRLISRVITGKQNQAQQLGEQLADSILDAGGRKILARVYARERANA